MSSKTIFILLFVCFASLTSCIDDLESCVDDEVQRELAKGYSLNLTVTLDNFGGNGDTRAETRGLSSANPMKQWEDYIDPEKFRVLFFNDKDQFLFESKSRWVKQLAPLNGYSQWLVSVPMFSYGNDVEENWDWDAIRDALTGKNGEKYFKIAILANRPEKEFIPAFSQTGFGQGTSTWIDNRGPYWKRNHTAWGAEAGDTIRKIFDLHHCQYDPVYHAKSAHDAGVGTDNFYDFIMGDYDLDANGKTTDTYVDKKPKMGATVSFLYWGDPDDSGKTAYDGEEVQQDYDGDYPTISATQKPKYAIRPDKDHPIPMYGVQNFDVITHWVKGTPFNLSQIAENQSKSYNFKSISLLRSVVKLELCIRKDLFGGDSKKPPLVTLWYSNVYSRCEPMDVWTPTEDIWKPHDSGCEWKDIMEYGLFCSAKPTVGGTIRNSDDVKNFQKTMTWFYGAWIDKGWTFKRSKDSQPKDDVDAVIAGGDVPEYPRIFNSCIQRNKMVICNKKGDLTDEYQDEYWHYVVYTGERNMLDPNEIPQMSQKFYTVTWMFKDGRYSGNNKRYYFIPIADYTGAQTYARQSFGPYNIASHDLPKVDKKIGYNSSKDKAGQDINTYATNIFNNVAVTDKGNMPWPLLRNHHYRIIIGSPSGSRTRGEDGFTIRSDEFYSESLKAE